MSSDTRVKHQPKLVCTFHHFDALAINEASAGGEQEVKDEEREESKDDWYPHHLLYPSCLSHSAFSRFLAWAWQVE